MSLLRKSVLVAVLVALPASRLAISQPAPPDEVRWYTTLDEATVAAKESGRPMLVDFWADWCAACKVMDKEAYATPAFAEAARGFVAVRVNYDKKTAIARKYNVSELPTLLYTNSYGTELFRHTGYLDGRLLNEVLHSLPSDVAEFNRLDEKLLQNKSDFEALKDMGARLRAAGLFLTSNDYYGRALDTKEAKAAAAGTGSNPRRHGFELIGIERRQAIRRRIRKMPEGCSQRSTITNLHARPSQRLCPLQQKGQSPHDPSRVGP